MAREKEECRPGGINLMRKHMFSRKGTRMSYCTARRQAAQARVRTLEERLKEQEKESSDTPATQQLRKELERAVAELVMIGDCGD